MDFDSAVVAHAAWKGRLERALQGREEGLDATAARPDNQCAVGKWLYGSAQGELSAAAYARLREEHARFHGLAADVLRHAAAGRRKQAQAMLGPAGAFTRQSGMVIEILMALRDGDESGMHSRRALPSWWSTRRVRTKVLAPPLAAATACAATAVTALSVIPNTPNASEARSAVLLAAAMGMAVTLVLGRLAVRAVTRPLDELLVVVTGLARGDLTRRVRNGSADELGAIGHGVNEAATVLRQTVSQIGASATAVASAAEELTAVSTSIAAAAEETATQARVVSVAVDEAATGVGSVSAGSEQMATSIQGIARGSAEAAGVAAEAVRLTQETDATMDRLGSASEEIGNIVKVITSVAEQTNLLALNATIEAARAGEAGKGFAVVAGEVKELAQATGRATDDISRLVNDVQAVSSGAVEAIREIGEVIERIDGLQSTMASAIEVQSATTVEMSRSAILASNATAEIARNIYAVASAAEQTTGGVSQTRSAADGLARLAADLHTLVSNFSVVRP